MCLFLQGQANHLLNLLAFLIRIWCSLICLQLTLNWFQNLRKITQKLVSVISDYFAHYQYFLEFNFLLIWFLLTNITYWLKLSDVSLLGYLILSMNIFLFNIFLRSRYINHKLKYLYFSSKHYRNLILAQDLLNLFLLALW